MFKQSIFNNLLVASIFNFDAPKSNSVAINIGINNTTKILITLYDVRTNMYNYYFTKFKHTGQNISPWKSSYFSVKQQVRIKAPHILT